MKQPSTNAPKSEQSRSEARQERINEIRRQLSQGTYQVPSSDVATAILDHMLERGKAKHRAA